MTNTIIINGKEVKKAVEHNTENFVKLSREQLLELNYGLVYNVLALYDNITFKDEYRLNPSAKKHKFTVQAKDSNANLFEIFYSSKTKFHICTRYNLSKYDTENAKYHEKWDMFWDIYTTTSNGLEKVIDFIFKEYEANTEEVEEVEQ